MNDEEIIDKLIDLTEGTIDHFDREDAMDMLYEVKRLLGKREALEREPCEDCISRQAVLGMKIIAPIALAANGEAVQYKEVVFVRDLEELPSVTPQPKIGRWIRQTDDYHDYYECEHCGIAVGLDDIRNYCPNCGAKMEVEE